MYIGSLPPISNRATWKEIFEIYDDETGEPVDLTDAIIVLDFTYPNDCRPTFSAAVSIVALGRFEALLTTDQTRQLHPGQYGAGCTLSRDGETIQQFIGTVAVLNGEVR